MIFILILVLAAIVALMFLPQLASWRTAIFNGSVVVMGAVVPVLSDIFTFLQGINWQAYITDKYALLGIIGGVGVVGLILRHITTGPAAWRKDLK